jgi:hypothetical protein
MENPLEQMLHFAMKNIPSSTEFSVSIIAFMKLKHNIATKYILELLSPLTIREVLLFHIELFRIINM